MADRKAENLDWNNVPNWLALPPEYLRLLRLNIVNLEPWHLLDASTAARRTQGLQHRYPDRKLFVFAERRDCDDVACWEEGQAGRVRIIHDFATTGWEERGNRGFDSFWDWFRAAIEEMIEFE
jgi:hypothetical protein